VINKLVAGHTFRHSFSLYYLEPAPNVKAWSAITFSLPRRTRPLRPAATLDLSSRLRIQDPHRAGTRLPTSLVTPHTRPPIVPFANPEPTPCPQPRVPECAPVDFPSQRHAHSAEHRLSPENLSSLAIPRHPRHCEPPAKQSKESPWLIAGLPAGLIQPQCNSHHGPARCALPAAPSPPRPPPPHKQSGGPPPSLPTRNPRRGRELSLAITGKLLKGFCVF